MITTAAWGMPAGFESHFGPVEEVGRCLSRFYVRLSDGKSYLETR
jgi:hypothetical protein